MTMPAVFQAGGTRFACHAIAMRRRVVSNLIGGIGPLRNRRFTGGPKRDKL